MVRVSVQHLVYLDCFRFALYHDGVYPPAGDVLWYMAAVRHQEPDTLRVAMLPYAVLLAATLGVGAGVVIRQRSLLPFALGASLFLVSDLVIAAEKFSGLYFPLIGDFIWITYGTAQMLIVYSVGGAAE